MPGCGRASRRRPTVRAAGEKESSRWVEGYARVAELAEQLGAHAPGLRRRPRVRHAGADGARARQWGIAADYLLRSQHDRACRRARSCGARCWASRRSGSCASCCRRRSSASPGRCASRCAPNGSCSRDRRGGQLAGDLRDRHRGQRAGGRNADRVAPADQPRGQDFAGRRRAGGLVPGALGDRRVRQRMPNPVGESPTEAKRPKHPAGAMSATRVASNCPGLTNGGMHSMPG